MSANIKHQHHQQKPYMSKWLHYVSHKMNYCFPSQYFFLLFILIQFYLGFTCQKNVIPEIGWHFYMFLVLSVLECYQQFVPCCKSAVLIIIWNMHQTVNLAIPKVFALGILWLQPSNGLLHLHWYIISLDLIWSPSQTATKWELQTSNQSA